MTLCRVCDHEFHSNDTRQKECSKGCREIMASTNNRSDHKIEVQIQRARKKYRQKVKIEFAWQRFALGVQDGIIFR